MLRPALPDFGVDGLFSVFDSDSGALLGDTGWQLDDAAAAAGLYPDARSPAGGSEPEGLDLTVFGGKTVVAVTLERAGAVALIDLSDARNPLVIDIEQTGARPEGIEFFRVGTRLFLATSNETPGTVSIVEVVI